MITRSLRNLIKHAGHVVSLFVEATGDDAYVTISSFDGNDEEIVSLTFPTYIDLFDWQFLEPLSNYAIAKKLNWIIRICENENGKPVLVIDLK